MVSYAIANVRSSIIHICVANAAKLYVVIAHMIELANAHAACYIKFKALFVSMM